MSLGLFLGEVSTACAGGVFAAADVEQAGRAEGDKRQVRRGPEGQGASEPRQQTDSEQQQQLRSSGSGGRPRIEFNLDTVQPPPGEEIKPRVSSKYGSSKDEPPVLKRLSGPPSAADRAGKGQQRGGDGSGSRRQLSPERGPTGHDRDRAHGRVGDRDRERDRARDRDSAQQRRVPTAGRAGDSSRDPSRPRARDEPAAGGREPSRDRNRPAAREHSRERGGQGSRERSRGAPAKAEAGRPGHRDSSRARDSDREQRAAAADGRDDGEHCVVITADMQLCHTSGSAAPCVVWACPFLLTAHRRGMPSLPLPLCVSFQGLPARSPGPPLHKPLSSMHAPGGRLCSGRRSRRLMHCWLVCAPGMQAWWSSSCGTSFSHSHWPQTMSGERSARYVCMFACACARQPAAAGRAAHTHGTTWFYTCAMPCQG